MVCLQSVNTGSSPTAASWSSKPAYLSESCLYPCLSTIEYSGDGNFYCLLNLSNEIDLKNSVKCLGLFVCVIYRTFHLRRFGSSIPPHILALVSGKQVNPSSSDISVVAYTDWGRSATGVAISHPLVLFHYSVLTFAHAFQSPWLHVGTKCVLCTP